jgi:RNA polymerase sigma-70 factor (ECF subfamily)
MLSNRTTRLGRTQPRDRFHDVDDTGSKAIADEDGALLDRFRAGDRGAFDQLVHRHERGVVRLVMRYVKNEEDAKDVAQRAFERSIERLEHFRAESKFQTWLYRIAVNLAIDHVRGERRSMLVPIEDDLAFTRSLGTETLVAVEMWRKVSARLAELPARQRLVIELRVFHDLTFEEVAAVVGSTEDAAKMNYHHAVKRLRALLPESP